MLFAIGMPGPLELGIILIIVLLLFGIKKIPELGASLGKSIKEFKKGLGDSKEEDNIQNTEELKK